MGAGAGEVRRYVVVGECGAGINTYHYGNPDPAWQDRALSQALEQARERWAGGCGRHSVEVHPLGNPYTRALEVFRFQGPERANPNQPQGWPL